ncbi:FAD-binding oxidoreductase [Mycetocola sp. 2940]|uniref:FAD-binding oxidoreductase n=1 Tax=Mycetocola sp. 2940 TaxID=3156452 RepID=UPI0033990E6F
MVADLSGTISHSVWYGWGDPSRARPLNAGGLAFLRRRLKLASVEPVHPPVDLSDVRLRPGSLGADALDQFSAIVGAEHVSTSAQERILHAGGKSTSDLIRRRSGDAGDAPDAVIFPGSGTDVRQILALCDQEGIAVVPFGGGTSVVGGVEPLKADFRAVIALDLGRMDRVVEVDSICLTATFEAGIRGPAMEASLGKLGFTLGHFPQSYEEASLGGYLSTRSAGQASTGYGRSDDMVKALHVETPRGPLELGGLAPATAAGPNLLDVFVGSEGTFGVITEATMRIHRAPKHRSYGAWTFGSFEAGAEALRRLVQDGAKGDMPEVCRLADAPETESTFALSGGWKSSLLRMYLRFRGQGSPALALFVWEGADNQTDARRRRCATILRRAGGVFVGPVPAQAWERARFSGPYLRDELLTRGVYVETVETATSWNRVKSTHRDVGKAIGSALMVNGAGAHVQAHISHVYPDGASLYFTFLGGLEADPLAQNARVKKAASDAVMQSRATITHHHAIGVDHAPYLAAEIGEVGVDILAGIKGVLDPRGIMNPGKLIPGPKTPQIPG